MEHTEELQTKYGPVVVWSNGADHIAARSAGEDGPTIFGVKHRPASLHAWNVAPGERGPILPGYGRNEYGNHERAAYTATHGGVTIGTTYHGYGVSMYRVHPFDDATEAAKRAWREEVLSALAVFVDSPEGRRLRAAGEVETRKRHHERAAEKLAEAKAAEREAAKMLRTAERALSKIAD